MPPKKKRPKACAPCRRLKQSCSNQRPCHRCAKRGRPEDCVDVAPTRPKGEVVEAFGIPLPEGKQGDCAFESLVGALRPELEAVMDGKGSSEHAAGVGMGTQALGSAVSSGEMGDGSCFDLDVEVAVNRGFWAAEVPTYKRQCCADAFGPNKIALTANRAFQKMMGWSPHSAHWARVAPFPLLFFSPLLIMDRIKAEANAVGARAPKMKFENVLLHMQINVPLGHVTYTPFRVTELLSFSYNSKTPPRLVTTTIQFLNVEVPDVKVPPGPLPAGSDLGRDASYMIADDPTVREVMHLGDHLYTCPFGLPGKPLPDDPMVDVVPPVVISNYAALMDPRFRATMYASLADVYHKGNMMEPVTVPFIPADLPLKVRWHVPLGGAYIVYDTEEEVAAGTASFQVGTTPGKAVPAPARTAEALEALPACCASAAAGPVVVGLDPVSPLDAAELPADLPEGLDWEALLSGPMLDLEPGFDGM